MEQKDYYKVLGVEDTASPNTIKEAYRKLAFQYHPDRHGSDEASAEKMKAINEAYAVLSNEQKRREYDAMRHQFGDAAAGEFRKTYTEQDIFRDSDIHRIFEEVAKSFGLRGFEDIFKEHYGKGYRSFRMERPGFFMGGFIFSGGLDLSGAFRQLLSGQGVGKISKLLFEQITGGQLPRKGADRVESLNLSADQAAKGGPYAYYYRKQSKKLIVKIPPGIRHGQRIRLQGLGEPGTGGGEAGDLYLKVNIKKSLGRRIKAFMVDFQKK